MKAKTVTEYWPQANGQAERFNDVLEKHVQTAVIEVKDWRNSLPTMLLNYCTTLHCMTGETPAKLLMQRKLRTKYTAQKNASDSTKDAKEKPKENVVKAKEYDDRKRHASVRRLKTRDLVLVTQQHINKYSTRFNRTP